MTVLLSVVVNEKAGVALEKMGEADTTCAQGTAAKRLKNETERIANTGKLE